MINDQSVDNLALAPIPAAITVQSPVPNDQSPAAVYLASLGDGSRRTMRTALNIIGELLGVSEVLNEQGQDVRCLVVPWASLRYQHTAAIRAALQERCAPVTANKLLAALRRVFKEARRLGQMSADGHDQASDLKNVRGSRLPRGRSLGDGEIASLMRVCADDVTAAGARDATIIALLRGTGLRRSEAVALDLSDYDESTGAITIRSGKGKKERLTYVAGGAKAALDAWLIARGQAPGRARYDSALGLRRRCACRNSTIRPFQHGLCNSWPQLDRRVLSVANRRQS